MIERGGLPSGYGSAMSSPSAETALERLQVLVGEWEIETSLELDPALGAAWMKIDWALERRFLLQSAHVPHPAAPDVLAMIAVDPENGSYTQHYFDSRGVVRIYAMELSEETWTLTRTESDFSELPFAQRYLGSIEDGGRRIRGRWEKSADAASWELDFELSYSKVN